MELPEINFTIQADKEITTAVSSWRSFSSLHMQGEGYIKVIAITYIPPITREIQEIQEVISIPRTIPLYMRQNLRRVIVGYQYAALAAQALNNYEQRLIEINIIGWVDYHRIYENNIRFQQWSRLTPRRIQTPTTLAIQQNERAIEEAPIIIPQQQEERAVDEAPYNQLPLTQEEVWQNIQEDDLQRRKLHDLYKLQNEMDKRGAQVMKLLNIDRTGWTKNDRWRYNKYVVRPVNEKWAAAARRYHSCLYSLPNYLQEKCKSKRREEVADF